MFDPTDEDSKEENGDDNGDTPVEGTPAAA